MYLANDKPDLEKIDGRVIVRCRKCGEGIPIDFGALSKADALATIEKLDRTPQECPGFHVELSGWKHFWRLSEAVELFYAPEPAIA